MNMLRLFSCYSGARNSGRSTCDLHEREQHPVMYEWKERFTERGTNLSYDEGAGCLFASTTDTNIERICELIL